MKRVLDSFSNKVYNGTIILLSNVYGRTNISESKLNIVSEFFSEEEFEYILTSLKECKYNVICYFDENEFILDFLNNKVRFNDYLVFNLARNGYGVGKKSLIPTFCDLNKIKYTASNGYACSFARNKFHINALLEYIGMNSLNSYQYNGIWLNNVSPKECKNKFIVKPLFESASQGISNQSVYCPNNEESLNDFVERTYRRLNNCPLIIQKFIEGYEAKTTIVDIGSPFAFPPIGVEIGGFRNLGDKIISDDIAFCYKHRNYLLNSEFDNEFVNKIAENSIKIYNAIGMQNYGRIDCRIDSQTHEVFFMDFSTMPYFVSGGEMLFAFENLGYDIHNLLNTIINSALITKYNFTPDKT